MENLDKLYVGRNVEIISEDLFSTGVSDKNRQIYLFVDPLGLKGNTFLKTNMMLQGTIPIGVDFVIEEIIVVSSNAVSIKLVLGSKDYTAIHSQRGFDSVKIKPIMIRSNQNFVVMGEAEEENQFVSVVLRGSKIRPYC